MPSSYTTNKRIEKPANGDYNNTWSTPVNNDWDIIDRAFGGQTALNVVAAAGVITLTYTQYQAPIFGITGNLTANVNYQLPAGVGGFWYVFNNTTGSFSVTFSSAGGGTSVVIPQGYTCTVISDGTNVGFGTTNAALVSSSYTDPAWISSLSASKLTGTVAVAAGGTGAADAATARTNLGAAAAGTNTDITSLNNTAGIQVGAPTGGAKGTGTINATALFVNGVAVGTSGGSVSSVNASGGSTGLTFSGGPITTSGTLTLAGTLAVASGGTGATDAATARSNLGVPSTSGTNATGTWAISITGSAGSLNISNDYRMNSLGVGIAASGTTGEIRATNNITGYYSSDARLKENVKPIEGALDMVSAIGGKTFDWTDSYIAEHGGEDGYFVRKSDFGVIAQDVEAVFPLAVRTREDGTLAVDYEKLCAIAFEAIKELRAEVEALKNDA